MQRIKDFLCRHLPARLRARVEEMPRERLRNNQELAQARRERRDAERRMRAAIEAEVRSRGAR